MNWKRIAITLLILFVVSNVAWALAYRGLWYDAAESEGLLDQAEHYIQTISK